MIEYLKLVNSLGLKPVYNEISLDQVNSALVSLKKSESTGINILKF
ncbi:MAG: hypothetical protein OH318_02960 [Candidatus Parvarchaeota archaeon]|nr:hypothetical protein [Candidatus Rehaiarchaeum fermentans]